MKYDIVYAIDVNRLKKKVQKKLDEGWLLNGPPYRGRVTVSDGELTPLEERNPSVMNTPFREIQSIIKSGK